MCVICLSCVPPHDVSRLQENNALVEECVEALDEFVLLKDRLLAHVSDYITLLLHWINFLLSLRLFMLLESLKYNTSKPTFASFLLSHLARGSRYFSSFVDAVSLSSFT